LISALAVFSGLNCSAIRAVIYNRGIEQLKIDWGMMDCHRVCLLVVSCTSAIFGLAFSPVDLNGQAENFGAPLKVMSFNIRYGTANDGPNHWNKRKQLVVEAITVANPDLLGVQEALEFQTVFLKEHLPDYEFFGRGRQSKPNQGEFCGMFYRRDRFEFVSGNHFWLSETPDQPGSKSWDSSLPRMVSWIRLKDKQSAGREFIYANTHFDHRGSEARNESASLIRKRLINKLVDTPILLCGDFNTRPMDGNYIHLTAGVFPGDRRMHDTFVTLQKDLAPDTSTMSAWNGRRKGNRIDWILHSPEFITLNASINYYNHEGRYPSDHYPVEAVVKLKIQ